MSLALGGAPVPRFFRFAQRRFGACRWEPVKPVSDAVLAAEGWALGGIGRDAGDLSDAERARLGELLGPRTLSVADEDELSALLERCPFWAYCPPLDLDVEKWADPATATPLAEDYARRLTAALVARGVGVPAWHTTNDRGGLHGDLALLPEGAWTHAIRELGRELAAAARELGIPLHSQHRAREGRSVPVVLDDSVFTRTTSGRGCVWRVSGGAKPGGAPKTPIPGNLGLGPAGMTPASTMERLEARGAEAERAEAARRPRVAALPGAPVEREEQAPVPAERLAALRAASPELEVLWRDASAGDRSKRLWLALRAGALAGATDAELYALALALPASKAVGRSDRYTWRTIESVRRIVASQQAGRDPSPANAPLSPSPRRRAPVEALDEAQARALGGPLAAHLAKHDPGPGGRHPARLAWAACLLDRGVPPAAVAAALGALGDAADARAAVATTTARLASGLPARGAGWLERTLGGDAVTGLALLLTEIRPTAATTTVRGIGGEVKRVERSGTGRGGLAELRRAGSLPRDVAAWLRERGDAREAIYGARDVVSRACQRPGVCARVSQQRRCGSGYHVGAPRRIVCESRLCGPCTARAVELEHDLALVAWRAGSEGPLTRPQDRGTACWAAVGGWGSPGEGLAWVRREYGSTWSGSGLATSRELAYDASRGRVTWTILVYGRSGAPGASQLAALAAAGRGLGRVVDEGDLRPLEECARRVAYARWSLHASLRAMAVRAHAERTSPDGADTAAALDEALAHASDRAQGASSRHPCSLRWPTRLARRAEAKARAEARRAAADAAEAAAAAAEGRLPEVAEEACACGGTPSYELLDPRDGRVIAHRRGPWTACAAWRVVREALRGPALEVAAATASDS